jgi:hypothetical protein
MGSNRSAPACSPSAQHGLQRGKFLVTNRR